MRIIRFFFYFDCFYKSVKLGSVSILDIMVDYFPFNFINQKLNMIEIMTNKYNFRPQITYFYRKCKKSWQLHMP